MADVRQRRVKAQGRPGAEKAQEADGDEGAAAAQEEPRAPGLDGAREAREAREAGGAVWRGPEMMVARTILARHYQSGWLICETVLAVALAAVIFRSADDTQYVFGSASIVLGVLGMIFAAVLAHGALRSGVRGPLVAAHGRAAFVRGLLLAAGSIRAGICLLVVALVLGLGRLSDATAGSVVAGTTGLIGTCVLLAAAVVVASSPLTTRGERMALLAVLDGALYSLANSDWLAGVLWVTRLPLLPIVACYGVSVAGRLSWAWLGALLLAACCLVGLAWLGEWLLARAEVGVKRASGPAGA